MEDKDVALLTDSDLTPYPGKHTPHLHESIPPRETMTLSFELSSGLSSLRAEELLIQYGHNKLPEHIIPKWYIFVSQLWQPMPIMIWVAALVEAAIQNWADMAILLFIQFANASIGYYEIPKAGDAVAALKSQLQATTTVKRDGVWRQIPVIYLVPGNLYYTNITYI